MADGRGSASGIASEAERSSAVSRALLERYVARLRARRRMARLGCTIVGALGLLTLIGYLVVWHTGLFGVTTVEVRGTRVLTQRSVVSAAKIPSGTAVESVDLAAVRRRVAAIPRVASVEVRRDFPHTIAITVTERRPAALLPIPGGGYAVVDLDCVTFENVTRPLPGLPVITVAAAVHGADRSTVVRGVVSAIRALPSGIGSRLVGARVNDVYAITLDFQGAVTVDWGGGDQAQLKARVLAALMHHQAHHYDVSAPEAPAMAG